MHLKHIEKRKLYVENESSKVHAKKSITGKKKMSHPTYPNPHTIYPIEGMTNTVFLKNIITNPQIIVGDYTYYHDIEGCHNFEKNVLYLFDFIKDQLIIGKFCQIASGVRFLMNGSIHAMGGISTYPFKIFGGEWAIKDPLMSPLKAIPSLAMMCGLATVQRLCQESPWVTEPLLQPIAW